jgi:hypothetical protein
VCFPLGLPSRQQLFLTGTGEHGQRQQLTPQNIPKQTKSPLNTFMRPARRRPLTLFKFSVGSGFVALYVLPIFIKGCKAACRNIPSVQFAS